MLKDGYKYQTLLLDTCENLQSILIDVSYKRDSDGRF